LQGFAVTLAIVSESEVSFWFARPVKANAKTRRRQEIQGKLIYE
jgi:hypothetical protein